MVSNSVLEKKQSNELAEVLDRVGYKNVYISVLSIWHLRSHNIHCYKMSK